MPPLAFICSTASCAPISSFLPSAAKVPVSGLSRPIFTGSSASDFTTNGLATCIAPIARPAFRMVRRLIGAPISSLDIVFSPGCFLSRFEGRPFTVKWLFCSIKRMSHSRGKCNVQWRGNPAPPLSPVRRGRTRPPPRVTPRLLGLCPPIAVRQSVAASADWPKATRRGVRVNADIFWHRVDYGAAYTVFASAVKALRDSGSR